MHDGYLVQCFNCLSDFDALDAIWCSCNPQRPSKVCPFCMGCFCAAGQEFKDAFWRGAPPGLHEEVRTLSRSRMLIGEMLVRSGLISTTQLLEALNRQKETGRRLGEILVDGGALPLDRLEKFLQSQHTAVTVDLSRARLDAVQIRKLGVDECLREKVIPLEAEAFRDRHIMTLVMADPSNTAALERVMASTGYQVIPGVAAAEAIVAAIRSIFPQGSATPAPGAHAAEAPRPAAMAPSRLLATAPRHRASHLQLQNQGSVGRIFYRIDGTLYLDRARAPADAAAALEALKDLAGLAGEASTVPRVGRARVEIDGVEHQIIVRSRRGREGEELSVKLLDPVRWPPRLDEVGYTAGVAERVRRALESDRGLIIVSSPPFMGGSSTIYALVMELAAQGRTLALVESPRAVSLPDTVQVEYFPEIRGSLSEAVAKVASSAAHAAAITGTVGISWRDVAGRLPERMLVLCRVEARTLPEALLRLAADGYPPAALAGLPTLALHQRLLRKVCATCRAEAGTAEEHAASLGIAAAEARRVRVWRGAGCRDCAPAPGFRGRLPICQTLRLDAEVAAAVSSGSLETVEAACRAAGLRPLKMEALEALAEGRTTPEEITRRHLA